LYAIYNYTFFYKTINRASYSFLGFEHIFTNLIIFWLVKLWIFSAKEIEPGLSRFWDLFDFALGCKVFLVHHPSAQIALIQHRKNPPICLIPVQITEKGSPTHKTTYKISRKNTRKIQCLYATIWGYGNIPLSIDYLLVPNQNHKP